MRAMWSDEELIMLKKMAAAGRTPDEMALVLKSRTPQGIRMKCESEKIILTAKNPVVDMDAYAKLIRGESLCL